MPADVCSSSRARVRACWAAIPAATGRSSPVETSLAAVIRELRAERGLTVSSLARRSAMDRRALQRLERSQRRPRPSSLWSIAFGLDPDEVEQLYRHLVASAVPAIAPDTAASRRARARRLRAAQDAGELPMPVVWERRFRLHAASVSMWRVRDSLTGLLVGAATTEEHEALRSLCDALRAEEAALFGESGNVGMHPPLRRRMRGEPVDVPVTPPEDAEVAALWRWLYDWQIREGRRVPRTARQRAIAAIGAAERARLQAHPQPVTRMRWLPDP